MTGVRRPVSFPEHPGYQALAGAQEAEPGAQEAELGQAQQPHWEEREATWENTGVKKREAGRPPQGRRDRTVGPWGAKAVAEQEVTYQISILERSGLPNSTKHWHRGLDPTIGSLCPCCRGC